MNENAKKWVAALRSGEYKQGRGWLHRTDDDGKGEWCCLGVACDVFDQENPGVLRREMHEGRTWFDGHPSALPSIVREWIGLYDQWGSYGARNVLTEDNDRGSSFNDIADIIESEPEGIFHVDV